MWTAQGGAAGAKIQHPLTYSFGYKQTSGRPKMMSALPPTTDIPRPTLDFRLWL